ncbi:adenine deaminase [Cesiribacter sp. SM1]|uniref:adenine deaminase n=1 Tax=Cesiribacter sp. SM1 TaxID=2861196 RepID=UPI001CD7973F|nr:adenine deaminase [Cesiribacter sp. SM1]
MTQNTHTLEGQLVDCTKRQIRPVRLYLQNGLISKIEDIDHAPEKYFLPPFVDAHVHIESSMLTPAEFARLAVVHGTGATISDPHEIGNVLGVDGVRYMVENGEQVPFYFCFGAPSCVPATPFETAGATITAQQIEELLQQPSIGYLAEMMNWPGVLNQDTDVMEKIAIAHRLGKPVDGHAPGLKGEQAVQYAAAGISTDHECFTADEALDKLAAGMKILIREGSAARNFDALAPLLSEHWAGMMFCSDDKHPDSLVEGHINELARRAVALGVDAFKVVQVACHNPVAHYRLPMGQLRVDDPADFIVVNNLEEFRVEQTWLKGQLVAKDGRPLLQHLSSQTPNKFAARPVTAEALALTAQTETIRVIRALDGQLITESFEQAAKIEHGNALAMPEQDILKLVVLNRYTDAPPAIAFIQGFGLQKGAIASSVAHDSHNLIAVGVDDEALAKALNLLIAQQGGIAAVHEGAAEILPLPIAGLMSAADGYKVAEQYSRLDQMAKEMGSRLGSPFMTLSFMALLVIPALKLSDKGLFDGEIFKFKPVFV